MKNIRLKPKFTILMISVFLLSLGVNLFWSISTQKKQSQNEMLEKANVVTQELMSVWEFISINQNLINYDSKGNYEFKRLHCSLVGKSIGVLLAQKTGYVVRYVRQNPRNPVDEPDAYENKVLASFQADDSLHSAYTITEYEGKDAFRYVVPMRIDATCLDCHGKPAGELDILGKPKEGLEIGDLYGALSLVMPVDLYNRNIEANVVREVVFFSVLMIFVVCLIYLLVSRWVTLPLSKLKGATEQMKNGDLDIKLNILNTQDEIRELADDFIVMAGQLRDVCNNLENKVELRTEELAKANKLLEEQSHQLEEANKRLLEDNQYKSEFLAMMSHELRTPLTAIIAFTEVLQRQNPEKNELELRILKDIEDNSKNLQNIINNILDMARLEAGKMELVIETVDMIDIVNSLESMIEPLANKKNIAFSTAVHRDVPLFNGDNEKLRCILENLVSNAIKFTPEGGEIKVWVTYDETEDNILINVQDNGIGIAREDQYSIFEKFVQKDTTSSRRYNGSGLGLALAKELTELHGGRISVHSTLGQGSLFTVSIPAGTKNGGVHHENHAG
jgi:two-component system sensor histidine kinase BarA